MDLGQFIIGMLSPKIEKTQLLEHVESVKSDLLENTLPPYKSIVAAKIFNGAMPFKSNQLKRFNRNFQRDTGTRDNFIMTITRTLSKLGEEMDRFKLYIDKAFPAKETIATAISYKQGTILRVLDILDFVLLYSRRLFIYTLERECPAATGVDIEESMTPSGVEWLEDHSANYDRMIAMLLKGLNSTMEIIDTIPDIVYDPAKESAVKATVGLAKVDPLKTNFIPILSTTIMFFGRMWYEFTAKSHLRNKTQREMMEMRLEQYKRNASEEPDASNDALVRITAERLKELDNDIKKDEKRYGVK